MKTVLIVDDEASVRKLLAATLTQRGHRTLQAVDGTDALRLARCEHPDVILLDVLMPDIDGIDVCRALKADPRTRRSVVVVLTAEHGKRLEEEAKAAGAALIITKPFSPLALLDLVERLLAGR